MRRFAPSPDVVERNVRGTRILVPLFNNTARLDSLYTLNATAAFIWDHARSGTPERDIIAALTREFDIDSTRGSCDVAAILDGLLAMGALVTASAPDTAHVH